MESGIWLANMTSMVGPPQQKSFGSDYGVVRIVGTRSGRQGLSYGSRAISSEDVRSIRVDVGSELRPPHSWLGLVRRHQTTT